MTPSTRNLTQNCHPILKHIPPTTEKYQDPEAECDLIMKGGITSGIVYPPAIIELAEKYRFRSIGGTSAGAIAAAAAAAAEYGRESGGFEKLDELSKWLGHGTNLKDLFQPTKQMRPLMDTLFGFLGEKRQSDEKSSNAGNHAPTEKEVKTKKPGILQLIWWAVRKAGPVLRKADAETFNRGTLLGIGAGVVVGLAVGLLIFACLWFVALLLNASLNLGLSISPALLFAVLLGGAGWFLGGEIWSIKHLFSIVTDEMPKNNSRRTCS